MFYEPSEIEELLKCQHCGQHYDEYYSAKILPCCNKTICYICVNSIEREAKHAKYKCIVCQIECEMPKKGFPVNELVDKLIAKQPKEVSRGEEAERLKQLLADIEDMARKLTYDMENGEFLIKEESNELRAQVQLVKEEKIEEINKISDVLLEKIDFYEIQRLHDYREMIIVKEKLNTIINKANASIQRQRTYLNQLKIDDGKLKAFNQNLIELKVELERERARFRMAMFNDQSLKFEANTTAISEELLGNMKTETTFTVNQI